MNFLISPSYFYAAFRQRAIRSQVKSAIGALNRKYNTRNLGIAALLAYVLRAIFQWDEYGHQFPKTYAVMTGVIIRLFEWVRQKMCGRKYKEFVGCTGGSNWPGGSAKRHRETIIACKY